jgi:5-methylthioadenosine/S-adenosylhomocysteine deaminase
MKTLIRGGYVVAFDGKGHTIVPEGVVVFESNRIIHVGQSYPGEVGKTIDAQGRLVSPGFINMHALASICITHLGLDAPGTGLNVSKAFVGGEGDLDLVSEDLEISALFSFAGLLKGGATTSVAITAMAPSRWESPIEQAELLAKTAGRLGARAYISHQYRSAVRYWTKDGAIRYWWDKEAGRRGLANALRFVEAFEGSYDGRIHTMLFPYQLDTCSTDLLLETKKTARARGLLIHMHTAQSLSEFYEIRRRHGRTPIQYLYDAGFLDPEVILTHVIYTTLNPATGFPKGDTRDLELLARSGVTVAHCPVIYSRKGEILSAFGQYRRAGVNVTIGTDAFPMDMIREMRCAAIMGKVAERDPLAVTARDVFNAATLGGARALGREDLGRLAPGAKADIVIVDLTGLHVGLIDDPIKTLVYMASQRDVETVIVDGKIIVEDGRVLGVDEEALAKEANKVNQRQKMTFVEQNPIGQHAKAHFVPSFPIPSFD